MLKKSIISILLSACWIVLSAQWSNDPQINTQISDLDDEQALPQIALTPSGNYYMGFFSRQSGNYNLRLQYADSNGNLLWEENGIIISDHPSMSWITDWSLAADHEEHAILTLQDIRTGDNNTVAYRISPQGEFIWGDNGIMLSNSSSFDVSPKVTVTAANNSIFTWDSQGEIIMQKISPEGIKQWGEWGITLSGIHNYTWPQLLPVGEDDFIMKYFEDSGMPWAPIRNIHAQRFDKNGQPVWDMPTVVYNLGNITAWTQILPFISDGNEGFYIAWHDNSMSGTIASSRVQHVNSLGEVQFGEGGVLVSERHDFNQLYPQLANPQNDDHIYIYWLEQPGNQNQWGIYAQKISASGERQWGDHGKILIPVSTNYLNFHLAFDADEDAVVVYKTDAGDNADHLVAMRLNQEGESVWESAQTPISTAPSGKSEVQVSKFQNNQWVFLWSDGRGTISNIFAQNLQADGTLGVAETPLYTLTILTEGEGVVEVNGEPYTSPVEAETHTMHQLEAIAADNWQFEGWSGDLVSEHPNETIVMDAHKTITAHFAPTSHPQHTLTITLQGNGMVKVNQQEYMSPISFDEGMTLQLEAIASEGWFFEGWSGDFSDPDPTINFAIEQDTHLTATFTEQPAYYTLTLIANPEDAGSVSGAGTYLEAEEVTIEATPQPDNLFFGWRDIDGNHISSEAAFTFAMPAHDLLLYAIFGPSANVGEIPGNTFELYPNPANDKVHIRAGFIPEKIIITDITGKVLYQVKGMPNTDYPINISSLQPGIYLVRIYGQNLLQMQKLVIQR